MWGLQNGQDREEVIKELAYNLEPWLRAGVAAPNQMKLQDVIILHVAEIFGKRQKVNLGLNYDSAKKTLTYDGQTFRNVNNPQIFLKGNIQTHTYDIYLRYNNSTYKINGQSLPFFPKYPQQQPSLILTTFNNSQKQYVAINGPCVDLAPATAVTTQVNPVTTTGINTGQDLGGINTTNQGVITNNLNTNNASHNSYINSNYNPQSTSNMANNNQQNNLNMTNNNFKSSNTNNNINTGQTTEVNQEAKKIRIIIQHNKKDNFPRKANTIEVPESTTVGQLREKIKRKCGLQSNQYDFVFTPECKSEPTTLNYVGDNLQLMDVGITNNCTIDIVDKEQSIVPATQNSANSSNPLQDNNKQTINGGVINLDSLQIRFDTNEKNEITMKLNKHNNDGSDAKMKQFVKTNSLYYAIAKSGETSDGDNMFLFIADGLQRDNNQDPMYYTGLQINNAELLQSGPNRYVKFTFLCNKKYETLALPYENDNWCSFSPEAQKQFINFCRKACQKQASVNNSNNSIINTNSLDVNKDNDINN